MPNRSRGAPKRKLTTTQQGMGWDHQQDRDKLLTRHIDGRRCWWCGRPMYRKPERNFDGRTLHADHSKSRSRYGIGRTRADRLLHDTCNRERGDGSRDNERPALTHIATPSADHIELGPLAMPWPWKATT